MKLLVMILLENRLFLFPEMMLVFDSLPTLVSQRLNANHQYLKIEIIMIIGTNGHSYM